MQFYELNEIDSDVKKRKAKKDVNDQLHDCGSGS